MNPSRLVRNRSPVRRAFRRPLWRSSSKSPERQGNPSKLADAELHFIDGELDGEADRLFHLNDAAAVVATSRSRSNYSVNGDCRCSGRSRMLNRRTIRELVLQTFDDFEERAAVHANP